MNKDTVFKHLETIHASGDRAVLLRQREILELCSKEEKSVQDLADHFNMNYFTIRNNVKELQNIGVLEISPRKEGRQTLYRTTWEIIKKSEQSELTVHFKKSNQYHPLSTALGAILDQAEKIASRVETLPKATCSMWVDKTRAKEGVMAYGEDYRRELKAEVAETVASLKNLVHTSEQILNGPYWDDPDGEQMFRLPVEREVAEVWHNEFYFQFVQEDRLDQ